MQELCQWGNMSKFGDMYKTYCRDREGIEVIEFDYGFMLLKSLPNMLYIQDIFVLPEYRTAGKGREMLEYTEQRAICEGKSAILGSCSPAGDGSTISMKAMLACGFRLSSCEKDMIYLVKELAQKGHKNG